MDEWDDMELSREERELAEELTRLGPLMGRVKQARRESPDQAFLLSLRARLVEVEPAVPAPTFEKRLRRLLVGPQQHAYRTLAAVTTLAAVAVVVIVLLRPGTTQHTRPPLAGGIPRPSTADLIWGFPAGVGGGGGGYLTPTTSRIVVNGGTGYSKHLALQLSPIPAGPDMLPVYRLAARPPYASQFVATAHTLRISGSAMCMSPTTGRTTGCGVGSWRIVAQNPFPSRLPLRSLAFSMATGETIYHDTGYDSAGYRGSALGLHRAKALARQWLSMLGWSSGQMPVLSVTKVHQIGPPGNGSPLSVQFGWGQGIHATRPAATVWISPTGKVIEALLWPPIGHSRVVPARDPRDAFNLVQTGKEPIAVEEAPLYPLTSGTGRATRVSVVQVLVAPAYGPLYLVPAYRYSGKVKLEGTGRNYRWYALASAVTR
jgi:hypothetical protein